MTENEIDTIIVETAVDLHRQLGPGLLESVYEVVLAHELNARGLPVQRQAAHLYCLQDHPICRSISRRSSGGR